MEELLKSEWFLIFVRLLAAVIFSGIIGIEREIHGSQAGLRTHILVGLGSSLAMLISIYGFEDGDPARLAAQVIPGIGFIGAGTIMRHGADIKGLTTAATLWLAAMLGLAAGNGYYVGGIIVTIFSLLILTFLRYFEAMITKKSLTITCIGHANLPVIGTILKICDKYETQIKDLQSSLVEYEGKECIKVSFGFMNPHTPKVVVNAIVDEINESILPVSLFVRKY
ncbi:TPA: MgtC/SapB family protein [bacterium]|jgi:putative Mg2+ transporter-C (MgtC) family protein|nr:MgtC/SapB family protein [bacterium]